ncbi:MAG: zinc-binding dehydrogenase [Armatimonadia bacterium]|nr:zinc-binding dehydrogenase [Armatimonadia bacterium]
MAEEAKTCTGVAFTKPLHAEVRDDIPVPEMDETGAVTRTVFSTISRGTELDLYTGQFHSRKAGTQWYPMLPGYIPVGEVLEIGDKVDHIEPGDYVIGSNLFGTWAGDYCVAWGGHLETVVYSKQTHSGQSAERAVKVPSGVKLQHAGLAMLGAIAYHGVEYKVQPGEGETILVIGQGAIGSMAAQLCHVRGARVIVAALCQNRLDVAEQWGAAGTINTAEVDLWEGVRELCEDGEPQAIIEVTGEPDLLDDVLHNAPAYCRIHAQGMYLEPISLYIPETLFGRQLTLSATCGERPEMVAAVLELMAEKKLQVEHLLTDIMGYDEATAAYERVHGEPDEVVTIALDWR